MEFPTKAEAKLSAKTTGLALFLLAVGALTSISLLSAFQAVIAVAAGLSFFQIRRVRIPTSAWVLVALAFVMGLSVFFNFSLYERPWKAFFKIRYYLVGALSIVPLSFYFNEYLSREKREVVLRRLFQLLVLAANLGAVSGMIGYWTGFNPLRLAQVDTHRNAGTFGLSITYGHSIAWFSVFLISFWFHRKQWSKWFPDWYLAVSIVVSAISLFTSHTRGAILAWLAGCLAIHRKIALVGLVLFALGSVGAALINKDFVPNQVIRDGSNAERLGCWMGAWQAFKNKPVLGYGFLNYDPYSTEIKKEHQFPRPDFQGNAHSDLLELLASTGVFGFFFFILWIVTWSRDLALRGKLTRALVMPFVVAFLISGLTQVTFTTSENLIFLMAVYALSVVLENCQNGFSDK